MASQLVVSLLLPIVGALVVGMLGKQKNFARLGALVFSIVTALVALRVVFHFDPLDSAYAVTDVGWLSSTAGINVRLAVGLDGLSVWMYGLSAILMVTAVLVSWEAIRDRQHLFYAMLLLLQGGCLGVFAARDIILFYVFFEFTLIPLFFLIGIWGSEERRYAAVKFFIFTLAGSLLTFLGLLAIVAWDYGQQGGSDAVLRFSIPELTASLAANPIQPLSLQVLIFVALFAGFAIKVPLFPLHSWLPLAHVQAPTAGSVFLAGILLKIGTYGFFRFSLPMLPDATAACMPWLLWLSVIGIVYGGLVALAQADMKRLIAYSSVSHLGFVMLGVFALNQLGTEGAALQMVNHGISTGALFALVGMLYERYHTREIKQLGGLARKLPVMAFFMVFFSLSSIGMPGLNGFTGEIMILMGAFQRAFSDGPTQLGPSLKPIAVIAVSGVVIGAWYMLWLVQRVFFGPLREPEHASDDEPITDLRPREIMALAPLAILAVWIGLQPGFFLQRMEPTISAITTTAAESLAKTQVEDPASNPLALNGRID
jgi:NADH-quinone oxidoreductase subunit M